MPFLASRRQEGMSGHRGKTHQHHHHDPKDHSRSGYQQENSYEDLLPPPLTQASMSSNSSGSPPYYHNQVGSSRHPNNRQQQQQQQQRPHPSHSNHRRTNEGKTSSSSDSRVFRGAQMLRKQIVESSFRDDEEIMYLHNRSSGGCQDVKGSPFRGDDDDDDDHDYAGPIDDDLSDWSDPLPPPKQPGKNPKNGHQPTSSTNVAPRGREPWGKSSTSPTPPQHQFAFRGSNKTPNSSNAATAHKPSTTYYVSDSDTEADEDLNVGDDSDDSTTAVLARANRLMAKGSQVAAPTSRVVSPQHSTTAEHAQEAPQQHQEQQPTAATLQQHQDPYLVPRVNEIASTGTFDTSSQIGSTPFPYLNCNSYLPNNLLDATERSAAPEPKTEPTQNQRQAPPRDETLDENAWTCFPEGMHERSEELCRHKLQTQSGRHHRQEPKTQSQGHQGKAPPVKWTVANKESKRPPSIIREPDPCDSVVPLGSSQYRKLMRDPGFRHAEQAGILWQSIVSQHVRFPVQWWNGARGPPLGLGTPRPWKHVGRHRVRGNPFLQRIVRTRGSAGRLLLHIIIRDIMTGEPLLDMAVGCFHPNARGVRISSTSDSNLESCRDIWLAIRPRSDDVSAIESLIEHDREPEDSPLGDKRAVDNNNLRAVFGETPPVHTILPTESELYEIFSRRLDGSIPAAAILLEEFLEEW